MTFRRLLAAASLVALPLRAQTPPPASAPLARADEPPAFSAELSPVVITAARAQQAPQDVAHTAHVLLAAPLRAAPTLTVDGTLRAVPGFSLFRRSDSFSANPTAQGVSLRGLGPSGASRSLVLLDGVPLNDPFGGWVAWTKIPRDGLARAEVVPGGGASVWGNSALGGAVQLFTRAAQGEPVMSRPTAAPGGVATANVVPDTRATAHARLELGDYGTRSLEFSTVYPSDRGTLQLLGRTFATDGFALVAPERRGPIDAPAASRHRWLAARWRQPLGAATELTATVRGFDEQRNNGTPYQRNASRERFASLAAAGQPAPAFSWDAVAYAQDQSFASTFSAVNATRTAETPASDQFAVPATAFGAAWTGTWKPGRDRDARGSRYAFGVDARFVRGETREHFTFAAGSFTRLRVAGGEQSTGGAFVLAEHALMPTLRATAAARVDAWSDADGHRRESDRVSGTLLRDDRYARLDGTELSPSAGLVWTPAAAFRVRASAQRAFRRPTLNELYRPFRVGPNVTEANAALRTERALSGELGAEWTVLGLAPAATPPAVSAAHRARLTLAATAFESELRDAVGNVTLARGPGTFPLFGTLAAGGVGRQRLNLDRTRVRGVELSARWQPLAALSFAGDYLLNDACVRRTALAPALVGRRLAQVPRDSAALSSTWQAPARLALTSRVRWIGRQFEDDENQLTLGEVVVADLAVSRPLTPQLEVFITVENVGDARIETGRTADGVVNIGTPRLFVLGLRGAW